MIKKIYGILKLINIDAYYQETTQLKDCYALYTIYNEVENELIDNKHRAVVYSISINFWYKKDNQNLSSKYKEIKHVFKENGFKFVKARDLVDKDYFGKNIDFKIKIWEEL